MVGERTDRRARRVLEWRIVKHPESHACATHPAAPP